MTIEQALQRAVEAHKMGKLQDAERLYRAILQAQPNHPDANHNLGAMAVSLNQTEAALPLFKIALEANPNQGQFWLSYIDALMKEKQFDNARGVLEQGRKLGLAGEKVVALEAQLKSILLTVNSESSVKNKNLFNAQPRKKVSTKKEKKKNISRNLTKVNQLKSPSQIDLNTLLGHFKNEQYDLAQNLATDLTQQYPNHPFGWKVLGALFKHIGKLQDSVIANQKVLEISPNDAEAHSNLGVTLKELGKLKEAETSYQKAIAINPDLAEAYYNLGITQQELDKLEEAEASYKKAIAIKPDMAEAHYNLGNIVKEFGRLQEAETSYKRAILIKPGYAEAHSNLGVTLQKLGRLEDAQTSYQKAIAIKPSYAQAYSNLGNTLKELGRLQDAETSYQKAILIKPDFAEAHYNLGVTLQVLGRLKDAETSYQKAILIKPDYAEAHSNLGITLKELGRLQEAEKSYRDAISIKPDYAEAHHNLGITLQEIGRLEDALATVIKSIEIKSTAEAKSLFVLLTKVIGIETWNQSLAMLVISALLEPWGRPSDVMPLACRLLKSKTEFIKILKESAKYSDQPNYLESFLDSISKKEFGASVLLQAILSSGEIPDGEIEILLTTLRRHFLKIAESVILNDSQSEEVPAFFCSLALQCFINEFVYFQTPEEIRRSTQLRDQLIKALDDNQSVPAVWVIAVACYFPLNLVTGAEKLIQQNWSSDVKSVLRQQIQEPLEELNLRASIPVLTSIDNQVSLAVRMQYEDNPYPRWVRLPKNSNKKFLNSHIQGRFPLSLFSRLLGDRNPEILIAGCGTGQHSITTSQLYKGAKILAVDLSMASLAYAKRKTAELDIESISYAQADLLKLASLDRTFDAIESVGVLHHLENPFKGLEVLISLLRPNGLMMLGFYSDLARKDITRVRNLIINEGIGSSSREIRDYRKHLLGLKNNQEYGFANSNSDFYSTSGCRDLFFHVQEHRMNLKVLADFFKDHNLNFLGFLIDRSVIQAYKKRFPNDASATNLDQWQIYEEENPDTFISMYQFYVQKKS
jgi:tetratricopeptide (TPR) repeat protein/2-polyprenyl-3-methyl-5-hydroxy-6-metoxy-1,4-benzoquinol methylase